MTAQGMTLVETLVGLALLGLVATLGISALGLVGRVGAAVSGDPFEIAAVQDLLRLRLISVMPVVTHGQNGRPAIAFEGEATRLRFVAELPQRFGLTSPALVELQQDGSALRLGWRPLSEQASGEGTVGRVLVPDIAGLSIRYFGDPRGRREAAWRSAWTDAAALPVAVEIAISFPPGDPRRWPMLLVAPRLAVPPS